MAAKSYSWNYSWALAPALASFAFALAGCDRGPALPESVGYGPNPTLPEPRPSVTPHVDVAPAVGWGPGETPKAAPGLTVAAFATNLAHPRWLYQLPNGDVLVAETDAPPQPASAGVSLRQWFEGFVMREAGSHKGSADRISILRDADGDGVAETRAVLIEKLTSPFGMALIGDKLYVANADALMRVPYKDGETRIDAAPEKVVDLPAGRNHHWTKSLLASKDGARLYVGVGSNSNVGENGLEEEQDRAAILEIDPVAGSKRVLASGLRNPVGLDWNRTTGALWVSVNERDEIGDNLVPDYMTSVKEGGFYGWPYSYWGQNVDARVSPQRPDLVAKAIKPDYGLGSHTACLGFTFVGAAKLGPFQNGAIVSQHGSWNRTPRAGYRVIFVKFEDGAPVGMPQEVLTGFLNEKGEARGRPVGVIVDRQGGLLVADDAGGAVWRVSASND
ncbi:PQQ-dependent sugar dehydrogenase [Methylocystis parvus]|uniref:Sorbosone dehydrogenase family protein n=1 Tax=Methylocystis parvus TaxID=134 RepID=A0A6B8M3Z9_9HYPH|nr:sorbosone dehydrogenase family protein [Methylocystis parvus]QGM98624.1 sorbosone dehydrogenase family protein [Methylocystis parvus]WBK01030.1 sorbosone dehydrogenase family protein [Methylocystis parvus OBBP]